MQNHKDNFQMYDENSVFCLAVLSVLGDREEQQDSVGYELKSEEGLVVVCDGMGGHAGGKIASNTAVDMLIQAYRASYPNDSLDVFLTESVESMDRKISALTDASGRPLHAGSTVVSVILRGDALFWVSVGDSRIYVFRKEELIQATEDHTYQSVLDEQKQQGLLEDGEYLLQSRQGEALVSFLGVNGLPKMDITQTPFQVQKDDKILLMSDGLYKLVPDEEIQSILSNFGNIEDALKALELKAQKAARNGKISRDNMTLALLKVK